MALPRKCPTIKGAGNQSPVIIAHRNLGCRLCHLNLMNCCQPVRGHKILAGSQVAPGTAFGHFCLYTTIPAGTQSTLDASITEMNSTNRLCTV